MNSLLVVQNFRITRKSNIMITLITVVARNVRNVFQQNINSHHISVFVTVINICNVSYVADAFPNLATSQTIFGLIPKRNLISVNIVVNSLDGSIMYKSIIKSMHSS